MKKLISLLMVLTLMVGLFSCLGISAAAADYEFTFLVTSAAGVEDGDYSDIAAVRSSYIADRGDAMLVSVDAGSDAYGMYEAGYELAWADPYSLDNYFTGIYPDGGTYSTDNQGTTWVQIGLPVGGSYADEEGYATVYFVAVGGENDAETLASFAEADGYVVAIGPWSAEEAVEEAADVDMFWTTDVDEDSLTELAEDGYMLGETLVVNAGSTAETVAVVSIADGVISLEGLSVDISEETDTTGDDENYEDENDTQDAEEDDETIASSVTLMIDGYDSISWTQNSEEDPPSITFAEAIEALHLYLGEDLMQTLAEGTDYVLSNESLTVTFTTDWLNSLFDNGIYELISEELTLTIVPEYADEEETETAIIGLAEDTDTSIAWDAESSEALTVTLSEGSTLAAVAVDGETLTEGTAYSYDSETRTVTFTTDWLNSLEEGDYTIVLCADDSGIAVIDEDSGSSNTVTLTLTVTKTGTADDSDSSDVTTTTTISTDVTSENWTLGETTDLTITLDSGSTLTSVSVGETVLTAGTDYYYNADTETLTIYASYLNTLDAGAYTITLSSGDESAEIALTAVTVTAAISVTSTTAEWTLEGTDDLTITLGAAVTLESVTIDGTALTEGSDYSYDSAVVTIDDTTLNELTAGEHSIVLTDDAGNTVTVTLTVSEAEAEAEATAATPSPTPTATATPTPTATPSYTYTWSRGSGSSLTVDLGKSVSKIDIYSGSTFYREATQGEDYTLSGTAITFSASMVNNSDGTAFWTDGTYHLIVTFTDGTTQDIYLALTDGVTSTATSTAEATATASAAPATSEGSSPDTGDTTNIGLYVVILIVLVIALAVVIIIVMKNKKQAEPERHYRPARPEDEPEDDGMEEDYDVSDIDDDDNYPDE